MGWRKTSPETAASVQVSSGAATVKHLKIEGTACTLKSVPEIHQLSLQKQQTCVLNISVSNTGACDAEFRFSVAK